MKKILNKKGFTLIECIVAIAVFAVMTLMILTIMGNAVNVQKRATDQEAELNGLIKNVVEDQSPRKLGEYDSSDLNMKFKGFDGTNEKTADFTMTYSTVDGYKNYIRCPACEAAGKNADAYHNNIEFMSESVANSSFYQSATPEEKKRYRMSHWFDPSIMSYVCPDCNMNLSGTYDVKLHCLACGNEDSYKSSSLDVAASGKSFIFDTETGSYICAKCMSGNVSQILNGKIITELVTADSGMQISGLAANTIRYSTISELSKEDKLTLTSLSGREFTEAELNYTITVVADNTNPARPTTYEIIVSGLSLESGKSPATMKIKLPGSYIVKELSRSANIDPADVSNVGGAELVIEPPDDYRNSDSPTVIAIKNMTYEKTGSGFSFKFTMKNYVNGNSFDYDYRTEGGLQVFWFGCEYPNAFANPIAKLTRSFATNRTEDNVQLGSEFKTKFKDNFIAMGG